MVTELQKNMLKISRLIVCLGALLLCDCVEIPEYAVVNLKASPPEGGTVSSNPSGPEYNIGTVVTFNAVAKPGYVFLRWEGCVSDTLNSVTKTITGNKYNEYTMATAYFAKAYTLRVNATDGGTVTISPPPPRDSTYKDSTLVTVQAEPKSGYRFDGWSGDTTLTNAEIRFPMNRGRTLIANFVKMYKLTVIRMAPAGNTWDTLKVWDSLYNEGARVTVTASELNGYRFERWFGALTGVSEGTITMDANKLAIAVYVRLYTLTINNNPIEGGTTTLFGTSTYDEGTEVYVTARSNMGYRFYSWSGASTNTTPTTVITMSGFKTLTANYMRVKYRLEIINVSPTGNGTVDVKVNGISTTNNGTIDIDSGAVVTVTATANVNYKFTKWSGTVPASVANDTNELSNASISFTMTGTVSNLTANFVRVYKLTVNVNPTYGGTVTIYPPPPSDSTYTSGTQITVTAVPSNGFKFNGWSGALTGSNNPSTFTMSDNRTLTANFVQSP